MKKVISMFLIAILLFALVGCEIINPQTEDNTLNYSEVLNLNDQLYNVDRYVLDGNIYDNLFVSHSNNEINIIDLSTEDKNTVSVSVKYITSVYYKDNTIFFVAIVEVDDRFDSILYRIKEDYSVEKVCDIKQNGAVFNVLMYNEKLYCAFGEDGATYYYYFDEENCKLELILDGGKDLMDFYIINDYYIYTTRKGRIYSKKPGEKAKKISSLSDTIGFVRGDYIYVHTEKGWYKISYDGKITKPFKVPDGYKPRFTKDETYFIKYSYSSMDSAPVYIYDEKEDLISEVFMNGSGYSEYGRIFGISEIITYKDNSYAIVLAFDESNNMEKELLVKFDSVNDLSEGNEVIMVLREYINEYFE